MKYYKFLKPEGKPMYGTGTWFLPKGKRPGKWMPRVEKLEMCKSGYHAAPEDHLTEWCDGPHLYEFEGRGAMLQGNDKVVFGEARLVKEIPEWNRKTAVLFACDCAEHVLHFFEERYPKDKRPREAIQAAREYVDGKITIEELNKAAGAATRAARAADAAAWAAARVARAADAATRAADAVWAAEAAARVARAAGVASAAARAAARAAGAAAGAAAYEAAYEAYEATYDTAEAAARADDSAKAAARAARAAAWAAAGAAERKWQNDLLLKMLGLK
jgi:hypothetical protein